MILGDNSWLPPPPPRPTFPQETGPQTRTAHYQDTNTSLDRPSVSTPLVQSHPPHTEYPQLTDQNLVPSPSRGTPSQNKPESEQTFATPRVPELLERLEPEVSFTPGWLEFRTLTRFEMISW